MERGGTVGTAARSRSRSTPPRLRSRGHREWLRCCAPDGQMEAYAVSQGRITSFRQLPKIPERGKGARYECRLPVGLLGGFRRRRDAPLLEQGRLHSPRRPRWKRRIRLKASPRSKTNGGKVIAYVEPFIIYQYSEIASRVGWSSGRAVCRTMAPPFATYADCFPMVAPFLPWQEEMVAIAPAPHWRVWI